MQQQIKESKEVQDKLGLTPNQIKAFKMCDVLNMTPTITPTQAKTTKTKENSSSTPKANISKSNKY